MVTIKGRDGFAAQLADKLRKVIADRAPDRQSVERFAQDIDAKRTTVTNWLKGRKASPPGAENLHKLGEKTGVSIDWLLGFPDVPMYRGQTQPKADLIHDLEIEVNRRLGLPEGESVNGESVLVRTTELARTELQLIEFYISQAKAVSKARDLIPQNAETRQVHRMLLDIIKANLDKLHDMPAPNLFGLDLSEPDNYPTTTPTKPKRRKS
jgi:transcriptional regulator with XRE-family HTH domain